MSNLLGVELGVETIQALIPKAVDIKPAEVSLVDAGEKEAVLSLGEYGPFKLAGAEGKSFRARTGVDFNMLRKLPEEVREVCWRELVGKMEKDFCFKVSGEKIVGIPKEDVTLPDYRGYLERFVNQVKPKGFANVMMRRGELSFGLVTQDSFVPPKKVDDIVHAGLFATFNGEVKVRPYNMRLVCTNGMTTPRRGHEFTISEDSFNRDLNTAMESAREFTQSFVDLSERKAENAGGLIGRLSQMKLLNSVQVRQITERLAQLGDDATEFDLVNLITVAQHERSNDSSWLVAGGSAVNYLKSCHCGHCGASV